MACLRISHTGDNATSCRLNQSGSFNQNGFEDVEDPDGGHRLQGQDPLASRVQVTREGLPASRSGNMIPVMSTPERGPELESAAETPRARRWNWKSREGRMLLYLALLLIIAAWRFIPRPWHPSVTLETRHHTIYSTATREQTENTSHALTVLYDAYSNRLGGLPQYDHDHPRLKVKLFRDRAEFRRINPGLGWAEAYYRKPYCRAYFSAKEINPYHWMMHESVHQLNRETAHLGLEKWLEEGLAEYFSTSRIESNRLALGSIDRNTYPVWWIDEIAIGPDLHENLQNGSVIGLHKILTNRGGPSMRTQFNLYYLHWWTLTHFIFESPRNRDHALELVRRGGTRLAFEELIGPVDQVEIEWHAYVRRLKAEISGSAHL